MAERETKLTAPAGFQMPELAGPDDGLLAEAQPERRYTTVYWDTPDHRLARWDATLRHRDGEGWTVKLPGELAGGLLEREEHTFQGGARKVPAEAAALLRPYVRGAELAPVARSRTLRRPIVLRDAAGSQLAEVVDDEVQLLDGQRVTGAYRELEVELGEEARPDVLDKVLPRLREAGASETKDQRSKYLQALGEREPGPPELVVTDLDEGATVEELLRHDLAASARRVLGHLPAVRLDEDPEAVHQARVGIRRLRSTLRTARSVLDTDWVKHLRDELKWLADLLGAVRDADVLRARLEKRIGELPAEDQADARRLVEQRLTDERDEARQRLLEGMDSDRYARLLDDVVAAAQAPAVTEDATRPAVEVLPPLVAKEYKRVRKAVRRAGDTPTDRALHRIRIRGKRTRYASEVAGLVAGRPARRLAKAAERLQDVLGDQHDAVVAEAWLRDAAAAAPDTRLAAGELVAAERAAARQTRSSWRPRWSKLSSRKRTNWF